MKRSFLLTPIFLSGLLLCACSSQAPAERISDLTLPGEISQAEPYNGASETLIDRVVLNLNKAWGNKLAKTDMQFLYLPAGSRLHDGETLRDVLKDALSDWQFDGDTSSTNVNLVFKRKSRVGEQTFVATRLPLLADDGVNVYRDDAILIVSLYPVVR